MLVAELGVSPVTVQRALAAVVAEGIAVTRPGSGTFVARPAIRSRVPDVAWQQVALGASPVRSDGMDLLLAEQPHGVLPLGSGYLDRTLRADTRLSAAVARAARRPDAWDRPPVAGIESLRSWFATQVGAERSDVIIAAGGQSALSATLRALVPAGDPVLFATPTYPGALAVARSAGQVPVPVPTDVDGIRPDMLARAFAATGARVVLLQATFANPDGHVLAATRRSEVLDAAAAAGAFVIEDDWARWLGHGDVVPAPLFADDDRGHVVTILSLTKVASPSLRVGAVVARGPVARRIAAMRLVDDMFVARPLQEAAVELVTSPSWPVHRRALGVALRERLAALRAALGTHLPHCPVAFPRGGVSLWLELPAGVDDLPVSAAAATEGVAVAPGRLYSVGDATPHLRLSWAGLPAGDIDTAVRRLARAVGACGG